MPLVKKNANYGTLYSLNSCTSIDILPFFFFLLPLIVSVGARVGGKQIESYIKLYCAIGA